MKQLFFLALVWFWSKSISEKEFYSNGAGISSCVGCFHRLHLIVFFFFVTLFVRDVSLVVVKSQEVRPAMNSFVFCLKTVHSIPQVDHCSSCLIERVVCPPPNSSSPPNQCCPVEISEMILYPHGTVCTLPTRVAICHMLLLSTWRVVNVTEHLS